MATPRSRPIPILAASLWLVAWLLTSGTPAGAEIYGWVDERGVPHYSDRIEDVPDAFRSQLEPQEPVEPDASGLLDKMGPAFPGHGEDEGAETSFEPNVDAFEARRFAERFQGPALLAGGVVLLVMLGLVLAVATWVLLISCRLVGQESPGFRKGYGIVLVQFLAGAALTPGVVVVVGAPETGSVGEVVTFQLAQMAVSLSVSAMVLRAMLCDTVARSLGLAVVVTLVAFALGAILGIGVVTCAGGAAILGSV